MAIDSLATILPKWYAWAQKASGMRILQDADYPFPKVRPLLLGTIVQNYRIRNGNAAASFQNWIDAIEEAVSARLMPSLLNNSMLLDQRMYESQEIGSDLCLAKISDFNSLIAKSQKNQTPVFALTSKQIKQFGNVLKTTQKTQEKFKTTFDKLADKIIFLTSNAASN